MKDIRPGPEGSDPRDLVYVGGGVVFRACDQDGCEVWVSDGSEAGTLALGEIEPGAFSSNPEGFTRQGAQLFFAAESEATGRELWAIDLGTCGDGNPELGEECDDGGTQSGDGCSSACEWEDSLVLFGTASGGSVSVAVNGVTLVVDTFAEESAADVVAKIAAAIAASGTLAAQNVTASAHDNELVTTGRITALSIDDPGLSDEPPPPPLPSLSAPGGAALALLIAALGLHVLASPASARARPGVPR